MGEANEKMRRINSSKEMSSLSFQIEKYPRDLLQRFVISSESQALRRSAREEDDGGDDEEEEDVELSLGLSLGGRFGVDKNPKKLIRASSIAVPMPTKFRDDGPNNNTPPTVPYPTLIRTSSLPTETEEEWRKRKKLQSLRRMEAKRRSSEKQRNSRVKMEVNFLEEEKKNTGVGPAFGLQRWVRPCHQGSIESRGRSSSSMSEPENKAPQGASSCGEAGTSGSTQSLQDQGNQEVTCSSRSKISGSFKTLGLEVENERRERGSVMEDMPCVFTKGVGPNGKRIDGILYKYGKGEEVRIMCVCHGDFLSPAEFVKHAGGGDVDYPLKHIVVNPSPASPF
ncbi:ras GTPase-activating protein-binding protein 2-like isoform X1 [Hibiscus syriacus]|uniref:Ninja-family protein n=2 Tax=Hibiscus syriacus TaxID=106335 RepID=A0A6A3CBS1_HIBSY|nr:ras GTPase-activating protein-binding protein 2-like isoform X1 [Hibiscus syriacus]